MKKLKELWKNLINLIVKKADKTDYSNYDYRESLHKNMAEGWESKEEKKLIDKVCDKAEAWDKLQLEKKEREESERLEDYYNNKYPKRTIYYNGRTIPNYGKYSIDVRDFFVNPNSDELQRIVKDIKNWNDDRKALYCQKWVKNNISYVSDKTNFNMPEYWAYPQEVLHLKKDDCDGGAILMANLMLASGIPYWKIRLNAGRVYNSSGTYLGGHCWLNYFYEKASMWVSMDWCFYSKLTPLDQRPDYKNETIYGYGEVWFSWNSRFSFAKSTAKKTDEIKIK